MMGFNLLSYGVWLLAGLVAGSIGGVPRISHAAELTFVPQTATFEANGKLIIIDDGSIRVVTEDRQWTSGFRYFNTVNRAFITPSQLLNKETVVNAEQNKVTFTAQVPLDNTGKTANYTLTAQIQNKTKLKIQTSLEFSSENDKSLCRDSAILLKFPLESLKNSTLRVDQWERAFKDSNKTTKSFIGKPNANVIEMFVSQPKRSFLALADKGSLTYREYHNNSRAPYAEIAVCLSTPDAEASFSLTFPTDPQANVSKPDSLNPALATNRNNIDFFKYERMVIPDYALSRNLIQNPSFEGGFHNWWPGRLPYTDLQDDDFINIDNTQAYKGQSSLHGKIQKGQCAFTAYHMAIPLELGQSYTFSFYAKADRPGVKTSVLGLTNQWGNWALRDRFELTEQWKRYSFHFNAEQRIVSIGIGERWWDHPDDQIDGANIWVDCVQLEKGTLTDYTEKTLQAQLITNKFANTYAAQDPKRATLKIHNNTSQSQQVDVVVKVKNFFNVVCKTLKFKLDLPARDAGDYLLDLTDVIGTGIYTLAIQMQDQEQVDTDYFRIAVIKPLDNTQRNKNIFSLLFKGSYWWEERFDYLKRIGIGSVISGFGWRVEKTDPAVKQILMGLQGPYPHPFMYDLANKNRILTAAAIFADTLPQSPNEVTLGDLKKAEYYKENMLARIEQSCRMKAQEYSQVMYWKLFNEPDACGVPDRLDGVNMTMVVRAMRAASRGIREGNPKAKILSPDPFNMYAAGREWLQRYLEAGGSDTFDIVAIHTYRPTPEVPGLDNDTQLLIRMLDKHGFTGEIWWTEGMLWYPYTVPELNTTVYKGNSASHAFFGTLTYDLGRSETIAAAFVARHYLVALKYATRVKMDLDWGTQRYFIDWDQTPRAFIFASNTLGNLLGNATYYQDVDIVPDTHIYVFEDDNNRPVAAMWNYASDVNHFEVQPLIARFDFAPEQVQAVDFMMNPIPQPAAGEVAVPLGPYPTFLIGEPDSMASFVSTLKKLNIGGKDFSPLQVTTRLEGTRATLQVSNVFSKPVTGTAQVQLAGQTYKTQSLAFTGKENKTLQVDLSRFANSTKITPIPLSVRFTTANGQNIDFDQHFRLGLCPKRKTPIQIDGKLDDWDQVPGILLDSNSLVRFGKKAKPYAGSSDLSAILRTTWDSKGLYLSLSVRDDAFEPYLDGGPVDWWKGDSLQVYFDTWADGRDHAARNYFDNNDYVYNFAQQASSTGNAYRSYTPEWQVAFLKAGFVPEIKVAIRRDGKNTIYEIYFPKRQIVPIELKTGTSFGFAVLVNDRDGDSRTQGLTTTPAGTEPHMHPGLFPLWVLTD